MTGVPIIKQAPGFKTEDGHLVSVSVFDDRPSAEAANGKVREWVGANLRDALPDPPGVLAGEVCRDMSERGQGGAEGLYVVVRQYDGVRSFERLAALADEHVVPVIRQAPGLRGHYVFAVGGDQGRAVVVSMFDSRENAMQVSDRVVGIMRDRTKEVAPSPPRVTSGKAVVAATA